MTALKILVSLILTYFPFVFYAQNGIKTSIAFSSVSTEDGLTHSTARCVTQDQKGFIWIGTIDGLNRYDGKVIDVFRSDPSDSLTIMGNNIKSLLVDEDGKLWVGTNKGLSVFSYQTGKFYPIDLVSNTKTKVDVFDIIEDSNHNIWVATRVNGIYKISPKSHDSSIDQSKLSNLKFDISNKLLEMNELVYDLHADPKNPSDIWIATSLGLKKYISAENKIHTYQKSHKKLRHVKSITTDQSGMLWVFNHSDGIYYYNEFDQEFSKFQINGSGNTFQEEKDIEYIFFDNDDNLWICSLGNGLIKIDVETKTKESYQVEVNNEHSLKSNNTLFMFEDNDGTMWVGTQGGGCNSFNLKKNQFRVGNDQNLDLQGIIKKNISAVFEDSKGYTWIGARNAGLYKMKLNRITHELSHIGTFNTNQGAKKRINHNLIFSFYEDDLGRILIGTRNGVNVYDPSNESIRNYYLKPGDMDMMNLKTVYSFYSDSHGNIWMGSLEGLYMWKKSNQEVIDLTSFVPDSLRSNVIVHQIFENSVGNVWVMGPHAFYEMNLEQNEFQDLRKVNNQIFDVGYIVDFLKDSKGRCWIGTYDNGIHLYDPVKKEFKTYSTVNGLVNNTVYKIIEDENGFLWFSSNKGISKFHPESQTFYHFDVKNGLQGEEFNSRSGYKSSIDGILSFGGVNGLNVFDPNNIKIDTTASKVYIKSLKRFRRGQSETEIYLQNDIIDKDHISIDYRDYLLQFQVSAPRFTNAENNVYSYQIIGIDNEWIDLGDAQNFSFTSLSPGDYTLNVRVGNKNGDWNPSYSTLQISVQPPWWKSWWAYVLYGLILLSVFYSIYYYRVGQVLKYQKLRTKISSDLHDDVGTILSSLAMESEMVNFADEKARPQILNRISELARNAMSQMRDVVWVIDSRKDKVEELADRMSDHLFDLFRYQEKSYSFEKSLRSGKTKLPPDVRQNFFLVFKEAVANFLKHSNGDQVEVSLVQSTQHLKLEIKDNGNVKKEKIQSSGLGLMNMKLRALNLGAKLIIDIENGFSITLLF